MRRIVLAIVVLAGALLEGCGGGHHTLPFKTLARPPLTRQIVAPPNCAALSTAQHVMGACLPHLAPGVAHGRPLFLQSASIGGPDFSNNDPVSGSTAWGAIAQHSRFTYVKSVEGTGYFDPTAQAMAAAAKAAGIPAGGYDFLHICGVDPAAEARFFVASLRIQGLLGAGTLRPSGDAEYGSTSCNTRSWIQTWVSTVSAVAGVAPIMYTGAWFWNPNIGGWWPDNTLSWISGYGVSFPYLPSGLTHLDLWQWSDHGYNGYNYADLSAWMHDSSSFAAFAHLAPPPPPRPHCFGPLRQLTNPACVKIRPLVYRWSLERDATVRALNRDGCPYVAVTPAGQVVQRLRRNRGCDMLSQRANWFAGRVNANLY